MEPILKTGQYPMLPARNTEKAYEAEEQKKASFISGNQKARQDTSPKSSIDTYVPEEEHIPTGLYHLGRDEEGNPKVYVDDPEQAGKTPDQKSADSPKDGKKAEDADNRENAEKAESCTGNTDKVDREIQRLKEKKQELEQQIRTENDEKKAEALEKKLAQVERELRQKDNDAYRRQHTDFS